MIARWLIDRRIDQEMLLDLAERSLQVRGLLDTERQVIETSLGPIHAVAAYDKSQDCMIVAVPTTLADMARTLVKLHSDDRIRQDVKAGRSAIAIQVWSRHGDTWDCTTRQLRFPNDR